MNEKEGFDGQELESRELHRAIKKKNIIAAKKPRDGFGERRITESETRLCAETFEKIREEMSRVLVGQHMIVTALMRGLLSNGHILVEGVPGIAKTLSIRALGQVTGCDTKRIQFTVDLLPTDIVGLTTYTPGKGFEITKGPIFANFVIADEINRAPPKCVLGDTPVISESGEVCNIRELIKEYNGKKTYRERNEYWIVPKKPLKLLAFDLRDFKIKPEEVKYLYKQRTREPYCEVNLKSGRKIKTSRIHPFFTLRNGRVGTVNASELKQGECVLVPRRLMVKGDNRLDYDKESIARSINVRDEIERRKMLYAKIRYLMANKKGFCEIKGILKINNKIDENLVKTFMKTRPGYVDLETNEIFFAESKQFGQVSCVKKLKHVTKELAQFMAVLIAEGNVNKRYFYVTMKDEKLLKLFINLAKSLFGIEAKLLFDRKRNIHRVAFSSLALVELLKALGYDALKNSERKYIPRFIETASDEFVREFLRVYYDCDGCVSRDCVKITTKSRKLANSLSYLLLRMGFVTKINRELSRTKIGNYSYKRRFYNLRLYGGELNDFYKTIGFYKEESNKKLFELIRNVKKEKVDLIPGLHDIIKSIRKDNKISHRQFFDLTGMHAHNLENPKSSLMHSRYRLMRIAEKLDEKNFLHKLVNGDFYCDFVKQKREVKVTKDYWLYDFSMKNNHSFVAGFGGIISHNTQSALLEAMQEKQVTIGKESFALPNPFFVMATENPLEVSGVYILPEAQVDRFLFKIIMGYPKPDEEQTVLKQNMTLRKFEEFELKAVTTPQRLVEMQEITKNIYVSTEVERYIISIVDMSRNKAFEYAKYIEWGGSPRASIGLYIAAKAQALLNGRNFVIPDDVKQVAKDVLRHRIMLTYAAQAEGIDSDFVIDKILQRVPVP